MKKIGSAKKRVGKPSKGLVNYMAKSRQFFFTKRALNFLTEGLGLYVWSENPLEIIFSQTIDKEYMESKNLDYFMKNICNARTYNGGGVLRATSFMTFYFPELLCTGKISVESITTDQEKLKITVKLKHE